MLMKMVGRFRVLGALAAAGALALSAGPAMAAGSSAHMPMAYTCTGGEIPSGNYSLINVTGECSVEPHATISVVGNVNVAAGAVFDAQGAPSTITVGRNVTGGAGSVVGLGCQGFSVTGNSAHECAPPYADESSTITVDGNVTITDAVLVAVNGITVGGNVTATGGGGDFYNYWSIKNNMVGGNVTVSGQTVNWMGVMFNHVGKNVTLTDITVVDEHPEAPGVFVVQNTIARNLSCSGLVPGVSGGFFGIPNDVGHNANGQCAELV